MKTATVRDLRTKFPDLARRIADGEEIAITRRGEIVARLLPPAKKTARVRWGKSAAARLRDTSRPALTAAQSTALLDDSRGDS